MKPEAVEATSSKHPPQRAVIKFLHDNKGGATMHEILRHLKVNNGIESDGLNQAVESLLENGAALGFLERKGSYYQNWQPKEAKCCRKPKRRKPKPCKSCCSKPKRRRRRPRPKPCCRRGPPPRRPKPCCRSI